MNDFSQEHGPSNGNAGDYDAESIKVLEGMEAVRKRPGMYIGDPSTTGLYQCIWEAVDNSIDEAMAGFCDRVVITIHADNSISVADNGRGIPVTAHSSSGKPTLEVVLTVLHAGGKFENNAYKVSGGLHGVGVSCVNGVSQWMTAEVRRDGRKWRMRFERGHTVGQLEDCGPCDERGTTIHFKPDHEIFEDNTIVNYDTVASRLRELSFLNRGVRITLDDEREEGRAEVFYHADGLAGFVKYLDRGKEAIHPKVIHFEHITDDGVNVEVAMEYNDSYDDRWLAFANNIRNRDGGTHVEGFRTALTRVFNTYAKTNKLLKGDRAPTGDDLREGLTAIISVKLPDPKFSGQTKDKLINSEISGLVQTAVTQHLGDYLEENPRVAKGIINKAVLAQVARDAARKARELARKDRKGLLGASNMPDKLRDCQTRDVNESEIFLVEGDSAGGSAKQGSDQYFQAILPLKGKIINVEKARIDKVLSHTEISAMIQALGVGIGEELNPAGLRYGKIIIMTDADVDGSHIRTLLLTFFFRQMLPLIENGNVYVAQPPLFKVTRGRASEYVYNEKTLATEIKRLGIESCHLIDRHLGMEREVKGPALVTLIECLDAFDEHERVLALKGLTLEEYLGLRNAEDILPLYRVILGEHDRFCYNDNELDAITREHPELFMSDQDDAGERASAEIVEFTEREDIERSLDQLRMLGANPSYLFDDSAERVDPFVVRGNKNEVTLTCLRDIPAVVKDFGAKQLTGLTRYKGLGEMNPDQLWETTMDPDRRRLKKVTLSDALEAERMFSTLMGSDVAVRRDFIERFALSVAKKLDV
ncbi:MAG: DNA topoisomerase (ATP-hydrolyzing) subunit B [Planctomycetota bacterium]|nr:MAG: DNA topoisomerase (ATP-hydrolyzing) subunit B [Planctomycetota bacterium]